MAIRLKNLNKRDRQGVWLFIAILIYLSVCSQRYFSYFIVGRNYEDPTMLIILGAIILIALIRYFRKYPKAQWENMKLRRVDRLSIEVIGLLVVMSLVLWKQSLNHASGHGLLYIRPWYTNFTIPLFFVVGVLIIIAMLSVVLLIRKVIRGTVKADSLIWLAVEKLKVGRPLEKQARLEKVPLILYATLGTMGTIWGCVLMSHYYLSWALFIIAFVLSFYVLVLIYILNNRVNKDVDRLLVQIHGMSEGDLDADAIAQEDSLLYQGSQELQTVGGNLKSILEKQMQSERTKINLITNVSHDLKTPLTSMIGYVDLLKKEQLSDAAKDYIEVIATKQEQLKNMIQDIFDLSKSTSGDVQLELEELDMAKLLEQTLADMEDAIQESGMEIRKNESEEPLKLIGDGKKLYRVFQNIISNALKYSLKGTRIFIETGKDSNKIKVQVKNTASYEMDFTPEEIMERFARGDESRNTEGHGLGLAIAESFTRNMGGEFAVLVDGDQFKVTVTFDSL